MNILYFHQHFTTPAGSGGTRSFEFARNLVLAGHNVTLVCGSYVGGHTGLEGDFQGNQRQGQVEGINVIELKIPYSNKDIFFSRAIKFIRFSLKGLFITWKTDFDVLFATSTPLTACIPGIFAKLTRKGKFIFEVRDLWPELPKAMGVIKNPLLLICLDLLETLGYSFADGIVGLSPGIVDGIKKKTGESKRVIMIPNGSDMELFQDQNSIVKLDYPTGLDKSDFIALYAGTHGRANGLYSLLESAKILNQKEPNIKIVLIGDGSEKNNLINFKQDNNLNNIFFLDPLPKLQVIHWMKQANLGLQILSNVPEFYFGTSPNKFFDYLSSGLPVLINYPGWLADIVQKENIGYFANPAIKDSLSQQMVKAYQEREKNKKNTKASNFARQKFNRKNLFLDFKKFIEEIHSG